MNNSDETIGDRTRHLPACSAVSQLAAPIHVPPLPLPYHKYSYILFGILASVNFIYIILEIFLGFSHYALDCGLNCSVGIATRYELDSPGLESRYWRNSSVFIQPGTEARPAFCKISTSSLVRGKVVWVWG
jgi:hypothetical protein